MRVVVAGVIERPTFESARERLLSASTLVRLFLASTLVRLFLASTLVLAGCAHERTADRSGAWRPGDPAPELVREIERTAAGQGTTCSRETPLGSRVPRPVCRSAVERERQRARSDGLLEDLKRTRTGL